MIEIFTLCMAIIIGYCNEYVIAWNAEVKGEASLAQVMATLDKTDPGWRYETVFLARNRRLASPDRNSAEIAYVAVSKLPTGLMEWCRGITLDERNPPNELVPQKQIELYRNKLKPHLKRLDELKSLSKPFPNSGFPIVLAEPNPIGTLLPKLAPHRQVSKLIMLQAMIAIDEGRSDLSIEYCRAILGASNTIGDEPLLISQLTKVVECHDAINATERALGGGTPRVGLELLQAEMLATIQNRYLADGIKGERVSFLRLFESIYSGKLKLEAIGGNAARKDFIDKAWDEFAWRMYRGYIPAQKAKSLQLFTEILKATEKPYPARAKSIEEVKEQLLDLPLKEMLLVQKLFPAFNKIEPAEQRLKTRLGTAVAAIACERFRLENKRWPKDLDEIPKSILKEVPTDLFTGKPLLMKRTKTGLVIYSTGVDGIDNGAEKLSSGLIEGTDLGFRLYDPEHRRQKAPEEAGEPKPEP